MADLNGKTIAFLVAGEGIEQVELTHPWEAAAAAGATTVLLSPKGGSVQAFNHLDKADTFPVDRDAVGFVRHFVDSGKPVAAICHAPWTLVEAGVLGGRTLTSWPSLRTDITNAGGTWVDQEVVVDGNLITSRNPDDLKAFSAALLDAVGG